MPESKIQKEIRSEQTVRVGVPGGRDRSAADQRPAAAAPLGHRRAARHHRPAVQRPADPARGAPGSGADPRDRHPDDRAGAGHHPPARPPRGQEADRSACAAGRTVAACSAPSRMPGSPCSPSSTGRCSRPLRDCFDSLSGNEDPATHPAPRRPARGALPHLSASQPSNDRGEFEVKKLTAATDRPIATLTVLAHGRLPDAGRPRRDYLHRRQGAHQRQLRRSPHDVAGPRLLRRFHHDDRQGRRQPRRLLGRLQDPGDLREHRQRDARQASAERGLLLRREVPRDHLQEHEDREGLGHRIQGDRRIHHARRDQGPHPAGDLSSAR